MALTSCYYSKLKELEAHLNSEMSFFGQPQTLTQQQLVAPDYDDDDQLLGFDSNLFLSDTLVDDPFWDSHSHPGEQSVYSNNYNCQYNSNLLPYYTSTAATSTSSSPPEIFPAVNYEYDDQLPDPNYHLQMKRQKLNEEESFNYSDIDFVVPNTSFFEEPSPGIFVGPFLDYHFACNPPPPPPPPPPVLPYYYSSSSTSSHEAVEYSLKKPAAGTSSSGGGNLSAQSIAARQRRRKITEKTQELGKLIPGGHKMNTADMFQAAFKYIKFLQTQVGILQTCASSPVPQEINGDSFDNHQGLAELLLGSTLIQEKLYSSEKCLVPKKLIDAESLPNPHKLKLDTDHSPSLDIQK